MHTNSWTKNFRCSSSFVFLRVHSWLFGLSLLFFCGCKTMLVSPAQKTASTNATVGATNSPAPKVVKVFPKSKPTTCQKLNPIFWFQNMDDPTPPDWYRPKSKMRNFLWNCRNPFHNLFFYLIGIADKEFEIVGRFPGRISNPNGGWNWTVCKYKWLRLPLISYQRGKFNFYLGWRNRGNFGMKLNFSER